MLIKMLMSINSIWLKLDPSVGIICLTVTLVHQSKHNTSKHSEVHCYGFMSIMNYIENPSPNDSNIQNMVMLDKICIFEFLMFMWYLWIVLFSSGFSYSWHTWSGSKTYSRTVQILWRPSWKTKRNVITFY